MLRGSASYAEVSKLTGHSVEELMELFEASKRKAK